MNPCVHPGVFNILNQVYKMKISRIKNLLLLIAILFVVQGSWAQLPQNRTYTTIVADALAQLPSDKPEDYRIAMTSLVGTGEEGLLSLINMMDASGKKSNETVEYAISGWTNFVATDAAKSAKTAAAYGKALALPLDKQIKQFIIRQLEFIGNENNIEVLAGFLSDESLCYPASQALANMDSPKAVAALLSALPKANLDKLKLSLINAIGQTGREAAEPALLALLNTNSSTELTRTLNTAISKVGTKESILPLKQVAQKTNYSNEESNSTAAYVDLLNKLVNTNPIEVKKEAEELMQVATKADKQNLRISALELLMSITDVNKYELLSAALKDKNIAYMSNALSLYSKYADKKGTDLVIKKLKSTKSEDAKATMIYWLGNEKVSAAVPAIIKYLNTENPSLQKSAIRSLANIGGEASLNALIGLLKSNNTVTLSIIEEVLASYNAPITAELVSAYGQSSDEGKVVALNLMGLRKMTDQYKLVYGEMTTANEKVQKKSAQTLKNVSTRDNLPELFDQIEKGESKYQSDLQTAVNSVLSTLPEKEQLAVISERMNKYQKPYVYYGSLANTGTKAALDIIMKGYNQSGKSSEAAFNALLSLKSFDTLYHLLDIARRSKNDTEITKAVDAMIPLIANSDKIGIVKANYLQEVMTFAKNDKQKKTILNQLGTTDSYQALLFIEQFLENKELAEPAAQAGIKIALNNPGFAGAITNRILEKISKALTNPDAAYQRQAIDKYLSENSNAIGFTPLFNGKDLTGWKGLVGNPLTRAKMNKDELTKAQIKADEEAAQSWLVDNGQLVFTGKGNNLCTEKQYGDFEMLVDWKLMPGAEPDAGIYLRGTPQVQIWDTARVNVGAQVGSGGLYNNKINTSIPLKVADQKVGEWNTFHIKMVGDRVTVYLNGELVTNNVILENYWDRNLPIFMNEQIELQAHGSQVKYRNIYIKEIPRPEPFKLSKQEEKEGFEILFDGTNMHKWTGNTADYVTEDGNIVIYPSSSFGGNLYTKDEFSDFIFRFQFQLTPGANNGLGIRTPMEGDAAYVGMELQILDNDAPIYANLKPYQYHGSVYGIIPSKRGYLKPNGEWNYQEVIAKGDYIKITLNGTVILEGNIREATKENGPADHKEHPGLFNEKGHIGFLGHGSVVKFKEIRIKRLK